ncbi:hypothetical protein J1N35_022377 [Gossypium stocksii]|uniref:Uncharacterized protein n=1 Tax=Gossypium stocksii TaxID=47602 RepID=A0A9D3VGN3_9ROSI|nr:hypothetical protein J1N35_022377 [Gossypium stocksii]
MGYRRSFVIKCRGGSGGLPIVEDVATGSMSGHEVDSIVLERNEGKLGMNKWWWILLDSGSLIIHLSRETRAKGPQLLSSCRKRTTKSVHEGGVVDGSCLRAMVVGEGGLEYVSTVRALTIGLFTTECFCHLLRLATDVDNGEFGSLSFNKDVQPLF